MCRTAVVDEGFEWFGDTKFLGTSARWWFGMFQAHWRFIVKGAFFCMLYVCLWCIFQGCRQFLKIPHDSYVKRCAEVVLHCNAWALICRWEWPCLPRQAWRKTGQTWFCLPKMSQIQQGYQVKVAKASEANFTMSWVSHFCALLERNFQHGIRLVTIISVANYASLCSIKIGHETVRLGRFRLPKTGTYRDKYTIQLYKVWVSCDFWRVSFARKH